jgi:hypothetical protein
MSVAKKNKSPSLFKKLLGTVNSPTSKKRVASQTPKKNRTTVRLDDKGTIASSILNALKEDNSVQIRLTEETALFQTFFHDATGDHEAEAKELDNKKCKESGKVCLSPMIPPIGNIKIRRADGAGIRYFTQSHVFEGETTLNAIEQGSVIKLHLPEQVAQSTERRAFFRTLVNRHLFATMDVLRPSGIIFQATPLEVSLGGMAFVSSGSTPRLSPEAGLELIIAFEEQEEITINASVMGTSTTPDGGIAIRVRFDHPDNIVSEAVSGLVAYIQTKTFEKTRFIKKA